MLFEGLYGPPREQSQTALEGIRVSPTMAERLAIDPYSDTLACGVLATRCRKRADCDF